MKSRDVLLTSNKPQSQTWTLMTILSFTILSYIKVIVIDKGLSVLNLYPI